MKDTSDNIIKEKRKLRNISQAQLGNIVGSQAMVSRIENGKILPNAQTIFTLCQKLEITVEEYFCNIFGPDKNITTFRNKLDYLYKQGEIDELYKIYSQYKQHASLDMETKHHMLMIKSTIYHMLFKQANEIDQNVLFSYFDEIINWQLYDIYLLESTINMLPVKKTKPYFLDILSQYSSSGEVNMYYPDIVTNIMIKYLEASILQQQNHITSFLLAKISSDDVNLNTNHQLWVLFLTGIYYNNQEKLEEAYSITEYLNDDCTAEVFNRIKIHCSKNNNKKSSFNKEL